MRVLIIGGTGNISTPLTKALMDRGVGLTLFNHDTQSPDWLRGVRVITGDRTRRDEMQQKLAALGPWDCVIDMIAYEPEDAEYDVRIFRGRTRQLIFCSTVDVYCKTPKAYPITEDNGVVEALPSFPYAYKKVACEKILWEANTRGDFALTVIRPAFTYNEGWSPGVHTFGGQSYHLDRLQKGKPILMHGDGTSIWVAAYRDDTASAFVGGVGKEKAFGRAFNVPGDEWMTHNHIWRTIARVMGAPEPDFVYVPTDLLGKLAPKQAEWCVENFRYNNIFDNSRAKRDLGFRYTVPFEEGVRWCIENLTRNDLIESCDKYPFYDRIVDSWRRHTGSMIDEFRADPL